MKGASFGRKSFETFSNIGLQVVLTPWIGILWPVTSPYVAKVSSSHEMSPAVIFLAIIFARNKLEWWKHNRCVHGVDTDRPICKLTFSVFRSSHDLNLRSNFQHDLLKSPYSSFDASWHEKHDAGWQNECRAFTELKVITKKHVLFFVNTVIFGVFALWRPNRWSYRSYLRPP